jgi:hypothetical protein
MWMIVLWHILDVLHKIFSITLIMLGTGDSLYVLHARQIWIFWFLHVCKPKFLCASISCWQKQVFTIACGYLSYCLELLQHLSMDAWSMMRYVEAYIVSDGGHFEHLLEMYLFCCH